MTPLCLYAVTDRPDSALPQSLGLSDGQLESHTYRDVGAVVSHLGTQEITPTEPNLWRYEAVVEALMEAHTVLPVRFGTVLPDELAVLSMLQGRYPDFVADLKQLRGRVELSLRVLWEGSATTESTKASSPSAENAGRPDGSSGREYLMDRLAQVRGEDSQHRSAQMFVEDIQRSLVPLAAESTQQVLPTRRLLLLSAYLVPQAKMSDFVQEVDVLRLRYPTLSFVCTGPWPAYSFVTAARSMTDKGGRELWSHLLQDLS
jgi:hypothetical protein